MSGEKYIIARHQEHPRFIQDELPNFLEEEAKARESTIPVRARQRHLGNQYWKYVRYQTKCRKNFDKNITRVEMIRGFIEKQR